MSLTEISQLLGNFGEFIGAIAVFLTLAYLAVQVRHGTSATQAASRDAAMAHTLSFFERGLDNQVVARADHKRAAGEQIDDFEKAQLVRYQFYNFKIFENVYTHHEQGMIADDEWEYFRGVMKLILTNNEFALEMVTESRDTRWWKSGFQRELDDLLIAE